jgi:hypothetical protein
VYPSEREKLSHATGRLGRVVDTGLCLVGVGHSRRLSRLGYSKPGVVSRSTR